MTGPNERGDLWAGMLGVIKWAASMASFLIINELATCKSKKAQSPGMEAAFDYVGRVIARRRFGYISEWRLLASWTEKDWDRWLAATDQMSN